VTEEEVTSDDCHSIHQVTFDGPNPKALLTFHGLSGPVLAKAGRASRATWRAQPATWWTLA
jgi:hypothetical protein